VSAEGINATGIHLTGLTAFIVILGFLLTAAGGLIGVARAIHAIRRMASLQLKAAMVRAMIFCEIAFVFGVLAAAGIFTQANAVVLSDIPSRLIPFTYFFWSPAFGVGILFVARHMRRLRFGMNRSMIQRRTAMAYLCVGILLIMPAASSWLLMSTTIQGRVTLDDAEVMSLSNWLRTNGDKKVILMGDWITSKFVGALARQPIQEQNTLDGTLNGALYYGGNMTSRLLPLSRLNPPVYLLINEAYLSHKYYLITWIYEGRPAPSEKDMASSFTKINAFPMLDRVYSSPTLSLYVSAHA
jgi:hypothetical protein